jgi:hypothetical protein
MDGSCSSGASSVALDRLPFMGVRLHQKRMANGKKSDKSLKIK